MTMVVRVKGIKHFKHPKSGIDYYYHRKSGTRIKSPPNTAAFAAEVAEAEKKLAGKLAAKAGTLAKLIEEYRKASIFTERRARTRSDYDKVLNYLAPMADIPLIQIDAPFVAKLRDRVFTQKKRRFANYVLAVLSILMEFGIERGDVKVNPVRSVKKVHRASDAPAANRPWTHPERETVQEAAAPEVGLVVAIGRWTALREGDILRLPRTAYDGKTIKLRTSKRGVPVAIPIAKPLVDIIDTELRRRADIAADRAKKGKPPRPEPMTLCISSRGTQWTESGFRASFFKLIGKLFEAGKIGSGVTFHGLRHSVATELRTLGFDLRTIADMLGQKTEAMAGHYSEEADLTNKLTGVVRKLESANAKRTKMATRGG